MSARPPHTGEMNQHQHRSVRAAIEVMAEWAGTNGAERSAARITTILSEAGSPAVPDAASDLIGGLTSLCGMALIEAAQALELTEARVLQRIAMKLAD